MTCPCGNDLELERCCGPYIAGAPAPTAEALMRSRYTAYVRGEIDYLVATQQAPEGTEPDRAAIERFSRDSDWRGLSIVATDRGGPDDDEGTVEFIARYRAGGRENLHHERSTFRKIDGRWLFVDGVPVKQAPVQRGERIGRNDPCPCGSGKKYKRCHGA